MVAEALVAVSPWTGQWWAYSSRLAHGEFADQSEAWRGCKSPRSQSKSVVGQDGKPAAQSCSEWPGLLGHWL